MGKQGICGHKRLSGQHPRTPSISENAFLRLRTCGAFSFSVNQATRSKRSFHCFDFLSKMHQPGKRDKEKRMTLLKTALSVFAPAKENEKVKISTAPISPSCHLCPCARVGQMRFSLSGGDRFEMIIHQIREIKKHPSAAE